jgi:hypothetical protein
MKILTMFVLLEEMSREIVGARCASSAEVDGSAREKRIELLTMRSLAMLN